MIGRSPIAFPYTSCPKRRATDVYVPAASQPVGQRDLAKFSTTIFHLVSSFVPIMTQCPASGFSALTGYGGRCTARSVPKETKKNSPIIIATNVPFMTAGGKLMCSLSHPPSTEALERSSRKTLNGDSIEPVLKQLTWKGKDENRRNLRNGQLPSRASA